ncbi:TPA: hypothetical protein ACVO12_004844, partial [Vibrio diabolicus]
MRICIVSPHIDDSILSCGGFVLNMLENKENIIHIVNVFCGIHSNDMTTINLDRAFEERNILPKGIITYLPIPDISQRLEKFSWDKVFLNPSDKLS